MREFRERAPIWARNGALLALVLSLLSFFLPEWLGGFNNWAVMHLAFHNIVAIAVRVVIFGLVGWTIGTYADRRRARARQ